MDIDCFIFNSQSAVDLPTGHHRAQGLPPTPRGNPPGTSIEASSNASRGHLLDTWPVSAQHITAFFGPQD